MVVGQGEDLAEIPLGLRPVPELQVELSHYEHRLGPPGRADVGVVRDLARCREALHPQRSVVAREHDRAPEHPQRPREVRLEPGVGLDVPLELGKLGDGVHRAFSHEPLGADQVELHLDGALLPLGVIRVEFGHRDDPRRLGVEDVVARVAVAVAHESGVEAVEGPVVQVHVALLHGGRVHRLETLRRLRQVALGSLVELAEEDLDLPSLVFGRAGEAVGPVLVRVPHGDDETLRRLERDLGGGGTLGHLPAERSGHEEVDHGVPLDGQIGRREGGPQTRDRREPPGVLSNEPAHDRCAEQVRLRRCAQDEIEDLSVRESVKGLDLGFVGGQDVV